MTLTLIDAMKTVSLVKEADSAIKVVVGGPHVNLFPEESISLPGVDFLVLGEGEETFKDLLDCIDDEPRLKKTPGLVYRRLQETIHTGVRPALSDLDALPFPARDLVPYQKYSSLLAKRQPVTTIFTSRGCPFRCSFCDRPHLGKKFRARSPLSVVDEMQECVRMGINEFLVYDDTFTVNRRRVMEICGEISRRRLDIGFDVRSRVDTVDRDMLSALKRAGCQGIHYGVESGSERILKVLNKGIRISRVRDVFRETKKAGLPVLAYFMIGNPSETLEDIQETFRVMRGLKPDYVHMTVLTPFPGTQIYRDGLRLGIIDRDCWREFAADPDPDFTPPHWGEFFTREELNNLLVKGYKDFYMRPAYVLQRAAQVRTPGEFTRKLRAGLKVLGMKP
jgi:radical SAM superfamily enzyme YgiQ (UPF0313 family)